MDFSVIAFPLTSPYNQVRRLLACRKPVSYTHLDVYKRQVQEFPNGKDIIEVRNREEQRLRNAINEDSEQAITCLLYTSCHVGNFFRTFVNQQHNHVNFGMVGCNLSLIHI